MYSGEYDVCDVTLSVYARPVWIYTQSNITNIPKLFEMFLIISKFQTATRNEVLDPYWSLTLKIKN
jgi:hypothetical protein